MILTIINRTSETLTYLSSLVTVDIDSSTTVPATYIYPISRDSQLVWDCFNARVDLYDGANVYKGDLALEYLNKVATSIGGAVVGLVGSSVPSYAILVGGKDTSNNTVLGKMSVDGALYISGQAASLSADAGYPVKIASVFNSTDPHPTNGQCVDLQTNLNSALNVQFRNSFRNIAGNTTVTAKSGAGVLHSVVINNNSTNGTLVIYDNTAGSGTKIFTFNIGSPSGGLLSTSGQPGPFSTGPLGVEFSTGLTAVTTGSTNNDITLIYR